MDCTSTRIPYRQATHFSNTVLDYVDHSASLETFYSHAPSAKGIKEAIAKRQSFPTDRNTLVQELRIQYKEAFLQPAVQKNIDALRSEKTFTITTAHQPNLFTGPLYFIYKILHAIHLAGHCKSLFPEFDFVPVFYMGSEDADLDELGHIYLGNEKIEWKTKQRGAVGRMKVDKELLHLITKVSGQLEVLPHGQEIIAMIKDCYQEGSLVQEATFKLVHALFGEYGLLVLIADRPALKAIMQPVFEEELLKRSSSAMVAETAKRLQEAGYKAQAHPREINLFYLKDGLRERIELKKNSTHYAIIDTKIVFSKEEIIKELREHPERFSPNVILRGLFQETILPNIAFIGGGGEIAYWLELNDLFDHHKVPFPVLVLRNSFLLVDEQARKSLQKLQLGTDDIFNSATSLINDLVKKESGRELSLKTKLEDAAKTYDSLQDQATAVDATLEKHVAALKKQALYRITELEKKILRAEKRKFIDHQRQIQTLREKLFPGEGLQERRENFMYWYARYGKDFIRCLYKVSLDLEQEFVVVEM
jgi:bacillithiol biosynthesis cysteine-adding enzyme BshC